MLSSGNYLTTSSDDGKFYMFDTRQKITESAFHTDTRKEDLYTHERYNSFGVMLGYGDGEIRHVDIRNPMQTSVHIARRCEHALSSCARAHLAVCGLRSALSVFSTQDPFVECIGGIEFNEDTQASVVSGYTESVSFAHARLANFRRRV